MQKKAYRKAFLQERVTGSWEVERQKILEHIQSFFVGEIWDSVGFYWPIKFEIDIVDLMIRLSRERRISQLALPRIIERQMAFFTWDGCSPMGLGSMGIEEPLNGDEIVPSLLLVPCVAMDRDGIRLGYGGGYFDRYLAKYPQTKTLGIITSKFIVDQLPRNQFDRALNGMISENGVEWFKKSADVFVGAQG